MHPNCQYVSHLFRKVAAKAGSVIPSMFRIDTSSTYVRNATMIPSSRYDADSILMNAHWRNQWFLLLNWLSVERSVAEMQRRKPEQNMFCECVHVVATSGVAIWHIVFVVGPKGRSVVIVAELQQQRLAIDSDLVQLEAAHTGKSTQKRGRFWPKARLHTSIWGWSSSNLMSVRYQCDVVVFASMLNRFGIDRCSSDHRKLWLNILSTRTQVCTSHTRLAAVMNWVAELSNWASWEGETIKTILILIFSNSEHLHLLVIDNH